MNPEKVFRKYDIRTIIGKDLLIDEIYHLSQAICIYLLKKEPNLQKIVVGIDTRIHSTEIKKNIINGILDSNLDVIDLGIVTTPVVYFSTKTLNQHAGIMITASHNPKEYNGLKIVLNNKPVWDEELQEIKDIYFEKDLQRQTTAPHSKYSTGLQQSRMYQTQNIIPDYINFLADNFAHLKNLKLNCIIDCANGTAGYVLKDLIKKMNWQNVDLLFEEGDGNFPNHEPDPSHIDNLIQLKDKLINGNYDWGFAFDGDCDRFAVMHKNGNLVPCDQLIAIFANQLNYKSTVVCDIKCSNSLINILENMGHKIIFSQTGCAYVKDCMEKYNAALGGELSGHFCFKDRYFGFDDGIYAMMRFIEISQTQNINNFLENYPKMISHGELRIHCAKTSPNKIVDATKMELAKTKYKITTIDGIRIDTPNSWGILRASNTEPVLSLRFEGNNENALKEIKILFYNTISKYFDSTELKEKLLN